MGGAVSSGSDNNELVDNLMSGNYIRTKQVEEVFRALDRADYMTPESRDNAYKDLAWRSGPLHLSSPCIYSEVMEGLELKRGLSFLNVGSGTGYLSTMVGLILGSTGISHGVEVHPVVYDYAVMVMGEFMDRSDVVDEFDFCQPKYYNGNGLCIAPLKTGYDRVYCGAGCPSEYETYFKNLIKIGGILVMPLNDTLVQVRRVSKTKWVTRNLLSVTFAPLQVPMSKDSETLLKLEDQSPVRLEVMARGAVRAALVRSVLARWPELVARPRPPPARAPRPTRMCIPVEPAAAAEGFNILHDLDPESGANEMNALLNLVISMGNSRVAGALRFDHVDVDAVTSDEYDSNPENNDDGDLSHESGLDDGEPDCNRLSDEANDNLDTEKTTEESVQKSRRLMTIRSLQDNSSSSKNLKDIVEEREKDSTESPASENVSESCVDENDITESAEASTSQEVQSNSKKSKFWKRKSDDSRNRKDRRGSSSSSTHSSPQMHTEVEIDLCKGQGNRSNSDADNEESKTDNASDEEAEANPNRKAKRQKMDSGIGDSAPVSPVYSATDSDDDAVYKFPKISVSKRRRSRGVRRAHSERRCRLAQRVRAAVARLPLPPLLKLFVNLNRNYGD